MMVANGAGPDYDDTGLCVVLFRHCAQKNVPGDEWLKCLAAARDHHIQILLVPSGRIAGCSLAEVPLLGTARSISGFLLFLAGA